LGEVWTDRGRPLFFVTFCTAERRPWVAHADIHHAFREFCTRSPQLAQAWVGGYVLMPDHVHVFVSTEGSQGLSRWVGSLKRHLAKAGRPPGGMDNRWQAGFFDHLLRSGESYAEKWNYVRMNPVRAGLVKRPDQWPFAGEIEAIRW
jgi:putative transposase